ncbi:hypothetical protein S2091_2694 [Solimicrobium silvestre]|uniref:Uncharacterized protein n=1 Tax=Solimicrobium silvestre TaxID=2099400 RepID=A0A2S9GY48_9BURK|nr:hypothetical protein S2091_2694 [Solimicrobium silvestre]
MEINTEERDLIIALRILPKDIAGSIFRTAASQLKIYSSTEVGESSDRAAEVVTPPRRLRLVVGGS